MDAIYAELINSAIVILVALSGIVTRYIVKYLKKKGLIADIESNKEIVKIVVGAVEQTYNHLNGNEKLNVAKLDLIKLMNEKKIKISEKEIDLLIESVVKEMKKTTKDELGN